MGVPGLFAWLRRKYPLIVDESAQASGKDARNDDDRVCHNLYIGARSVPRVLRVGLVWSVITRLSFLT